VLPSRCSRQQGFCHPGRWQGSLNLSCYVLLPIYIKQNTLFNCENLKSCAIRTKIVPLSPCSHISSTHNPGKHCLYRMSYKCNHIACGLLEFFFTEWNFPDISESSLYPWFVLFIAKQY
jgi:hypothetical protein